MSVPYVPGDRDMPKWWTEHDEVILRGAVAELEQLPRVRDAVPGAHRVEESRSGGVIVWLALALIFMVMVVAALVFAFAPYDGGRVVTPANTGTAPATMPDPTWMHGKP